MAAVVRIKRKQQQSIERRHPWIFSGAIINKDSHIEEGDIVRVENNQGDFLGHGHYQKGSIAIRVLSFEDRPIDQAFWNESIHDAYQLRQRLTLPSKQTDAYRLIHGEGDGLPGLIIDVYAGNIVIQCHSIGMYKNISEISTAIKNVLPETYSIYIKSPSIRRQNDNVSINDHYVDDHGASTLIKENDVVFEVNWETGQKTGFFLDQRDNRQLVGSVSHGKSVLNCFCYSGGFSIYALKYGAQRVTSVDISSTATELVKKNHELNQCDDQKHDILTANVMEYLQNNDIERQDIVIIDPPAFAKSKNKRHNAVQAYKRLNLLALKKVKKGGLLFTFSCSQVVDTRLFENTVRAAAIESGRDIKILRSLSQGSDHPINIYHPEGHYLKGLMLYVTN